MNPAKLLFLLSILIFSLSCHNQNSDSKAVALTDSTSYTGLTGDSVKLVKTAAIRSKVKDVEISSKAVFELAGNYGGMVFHQALSSREGDSREFKLSKDSLMVISTYIPTADLVVRVPSVNLQKFLFDVASLGYLTESNTIDIQDKSLEYLRKSLEQKNRDAIVDKVPLNKTNTSGDLTRIRLKDEAIDQQIQNREINADAQYSSVNISFFQNQIVRKEFIPNYDLSGYDLPFWSRLRNSLSDGSNYFLSFILVLANLWVFIILGIACFWGFKWYHKKRSNGRQTLTPKTGNLIG